MPKLTSQVNKPIVLAGATAALWPSLAGVTVFESETPFRLQSLKLAPGILTQRVTRANGTGLLTFAYRLALTETDYDFELIAMLSFMLSGLALSFADFRVDGPGTIPPATFHSSPQDGYVFKFNYGLSVEQSSRFFFLTTNAREFSETGGKLKLVTGRKSISLDIACPTGAPSTRSTSVTQLIEREAKKSAEQSTIDSPSAISGSE